MFPCHLEQSRRSLQFGVSYEPLIAPLWRVSYGNFELRKPVLPVDLMEANPRLDSFGDQKNG